MTWDVYLQSATEAEYMLVADGAEGDMAELLDLFRPGSAGWCVVLLPHGTEPPRCDWRVNS